MSEFAIEPMPNKIKCVEDLAPVTDRRPPRSRETTRHAQRASCPSPPSVRASRATTPSGTKTAQIRPLTSREPAIARRCTQCKNIQLREHLALGRGAQEKSVLRAHSGARERRIDGSHGAALGALARVRCNRSRRQPTRRGENAIRFAADADRGHGIATSIMPRATPRADAHRGL